MPAPAYAPPQPAYATPAYTPPAAPIAPLTANQFTFRNTGMGFILPVLLLIISLFMGMIHPVFLSIENISVIFKQSTVYAAITFAAVLPARAKGSDLSFGNVVSLSSVIIGLALQSGGSSFSGLLLAILAAAVVGAVNGVANGVIRVRSILLTVLISAAVTGVVSFIVGQIALGLTDGYAIRTDVPAISLNMAAIMLLLISFALAFFLNLGTKLGTPLYNHGALHCGLYGQRHHCRFGGLLLQYTDKRSHTNHRQRP